MERSLATIQSILALNPIEGADRIEVASILGWKCVVKRGDFKVGDLVVFCEVDSILPFATWSEFLRHKDNPDKPIRIKTIRLRKQISQGICFGLSILPSVTPYEFYHEGQDVTEILGIKKYEIYIPAQLAGKIKGNFPSFLKKTDSTRLQSYPKVLNEIMDKEIYVTIKLDGTSSTFYKKDDKFGVCSRNLEQLESQSVYWDIVNKYNLKEKLPNNFAISGEIFGNGIQKNKMGSKDVNFMAFDVWDIQNHVYLDFDEQQKLLQLLNIPSVPIVYRGFCKWLSIDELLQLSSQQKYENNSPAEGIVIRPTVGEYSKVLDDRLAFKVINNEFLLKYGE